jgi:hypothetical protein
MTSAGRYDVIFSSARFNLAQPRDYFINDCCYGDDAAAWLIEQLRSRGLSTAEPAQEDWGWYFDAQFQGNAYFIGVGGVSDEDPADPNRGQWRMIVEKHRSLWEKLTGTNRLNEDDAFIAILKDVVSHEPGLNLAGVE